MRSRTVGEGIDINVRQLRYFVKVVEVGSLTAAAEQLHVAQPALGLQIRNLEEDIGTTLLERHSRGVQVTEAGKILYRNATAIIQAFEDARQEIAGFIGKERKIIRFGATSSIMSLIGPDVQVKSRETMPNVHLSLTEALSYVLVSSLEEDHLDAVLAYKALDHPGVSVAAIMEEDLVAVFSPDADPSNDPITFYELSRRDLVLAGQRDIVRNAVAAMAERLHLPMNIAYETQSEAATLDLVKRGIAGTVLPLGIVAKELKEGTLRGRVIIEPHVRRTLYLLERKKALTFQHRTAFHLFIDRMVKELQLRLGSLASPLGSSGLFRRVDEAEADARFVRPYDED